MNQHLMHCLLLLVPGLLVIAPVLAQTDTQAAREYHGCIDAARSNPEDGFGRATNWIGLGGGVPARHCQAVALVGLKQYAEAARRLETLAQEAPLEAPMKAEMLAQAGNAWLLAGAAERAKGVLDAALELVPDDPDLRIDRAMAAAAGEDFAAAVRDLSAVIERFPDRADALALRASAYRRLGRLDQAMTDAVTALAVAPEHPEALLERGILSRRAGDGHAARRDWLKVIEVAPNTPAAEAAREELQKMDGPAR